MVDRQQPASGVIALSARYPAQGSTVYGISYFYSIPSRLQTLNVSRLNHGLAGLCLSVRRIPVHIEGNIDRPTVMQPHCLGRLHVVHSTRTTIVRELQTSKNLLQLLKRLFSLPALSCSMRFLFENTQLFWYLSFGFQIGRVNRRCAVLLQLVEHGDNLSIFPCLYPILV